MINRTENSIDQITLWINHKYKNHILKILPKVLIDIVISNETYLNILLSKKITVNTILNQKTKENINTYNKIPELLKKLSQNLDTYIIKEKELITELTNQCNEFIALRKEDKFE